MNKATLKPTLPHLIKGESYTQIIYYWLPELISLMILIVFPPLFDAYIISNSQSTTAYGVFSLATSCLHFLIKSAEVIPVAAIAIIGRHNGAERYTECGKSFVATFWFTFLLGVAQFVLVLFWSPLIYHWLGASAEVIELGKTYLELRSFGVFLIFLSLAFLGFLRAVKNTKIPMIINIVGVATYMFFDYALVLGKFGFPIMNLNGSALATIIQYTIMNLLAIGYLLFNKSYQRYFDSVTPFSFSITQIKSLLNLSWPIMLDKLSFAFSFIWLTRLANKISLETTAAFGTITHLERMALLPALAFAQILTFLISNRLGAQDDEGAVANLKKVLILTFSITALTLAILTYKASFFVASFDPHHRFTLLGAFALPFINLLAFFDCIQVILASALRGAGDVKTVMFTRFFGTLFFFIPLSFGISILPIEHEGIKFILLYNSLYLSAALMGFFFLQRIISGKWKQQKV